MQSANPLAPDLNDILTRTAGLWREFKGARVFVTGGTGFFGCWLLESFLWANDSLHLGASAVVLTRNPGAFEAQAQHLARHPAVSLHEGDVRTFAFPRGGFSHVIHAATAASAALNDGDPLLMFDTIVAGTARVLEFAVRCGARKLLLTSSGAVYGPQPAEIRHITESYPGGPDPLEPRSAYAEGKRAAELLCAVYSHSHGLEAKIARAFAFLGPYMPLDTHFAIGNFIQDCLEARPIQVRGDGTPFRSYLYAADLAAWLWTILAKGQPCRPYNVGSDADIAIADLAREVAAVVAPGTPVHIAGRPDPRRPAPRYVPSIERARAELHLATWTPLPEAIRKTACWCRSAASARTARHA